MIEQLRQTELLKEGKEDAISQVQSLMVSEDGFKQTSLGKLDDLQQQTLLELNLHRD